MHYTIPQLKTKATSDMTVVYTSKYYQAIYGIPRRLSMSYDG